MNKIILSLVLGVVSILVAAPYAAAKPLASVKVTTPVGMDISYPQCGTRLVKTQAFGIVGVNGGLATTTNPCLKDQLVWASASVGGTSQEKIQVYVNTGNPGGLGTVSWPTSSTPENPHGVCDNSDSLACAWQYGWNRASEDIDLRFVPAATQAGINALPATYKWWLDVETANTWKEPTSEFNTLSNVSVLEGMTAHFQSVGARVGLYSTGYQWNQIVGSSVSLTSNLNGLDNWRAGATTLDFARQSCTIDAPLTIGGKVVLEQYVFSGRDYDYSCV